MRIHQRSLSLPAPQPADDSLFVPSLPLLTDIDIVLDDLDSSLFPGVSSSVKVHNGFGEAHERCVLSSY